jgi:hypothetical protein
MNVQQSDLIDPALVAEVDLARAAAQEEAGDERVGDYVEYQIEDSAAVTHLFEADKPGYRGWRWAVTITSAGPECDVTVSEVVLLPGPTALVAPEWIPWQQRVQAGDLGVGDLLPTSPDDPRLVPAYVASDDPAVEDVAAEVGLGRVRVMSRPARLDAAERWQQSEFGPRSDMARSAPAHCGTCGFYLPLAGALRAAFGTCGNEMAPADGHVVHVEYGCGAHSEAEVEQVSPVLVADLIYDDALLDVEPLTVVDTLPSPAGAAVPGVEAGDVPVVADGSGDSESAGADESPVESDATGSAADVASGSEPAGADEVPVESDDSASEAAVDVAPVERPGESESAGSGEAGSSSAGVVESAAVDDAPEPGGSESAGSGESPVETDSASTGSVAEPGPDAVGSESAADVASGSEPAGSGESPEGSASGTVAESGTEDSDGSAPEAADLPGVASEEGPARDEPEAGPAVGEAPAPVVVPGGLAGAEDAAPATIEPIVTAETAGNDERASRE